MKLSFLAILAGIAGLVLLPAQRPDGTFSGNYPTHVPFEVMSVFPREGPPGFYQQVEQRDLQALTAQGWELVSVAPYIYRNEERGTSNPKAVVTQTYPAYFFKRARMIR